MDERRRQLRDEFKARQRAAVRESMPISDDQARLLFDHLDAHLGKSGCDRARRLTDGWAASNSVDAAALGRWLDSVNGFCDCEVLANAQQAWKESLRGTDRERR